MTRTFKPRAMCCCYPTLPFIGFGMGLLAIPYPVAILLSILNIVTAGWIGALYWVVSSNSKEREVDRTAAAVLAITGTGFGFLAGLLWAGRDMVNVPLCLIGLGLGLIAAIVYLVRVYPVDLGLCEFKQVGDSAV